MHLIQPVLSLTLLCAVTSHRGDIPFVPIHGSYFRIRDKDCPRPENSAPFLWASSFQRVLKTERPIDIHQLQHTDELAEKIETRSCTH